MAVPEPTLLTYSPSSPHSPVIPTKAVGACEHSACTGDPCPWKSVSFILHARFGQCSMADGWRPLMADRSIKAWKRRKGELLRHHILFSDFIYWISSPASFFFFFSFFFSLSLLSLRVFSGFSYDIFSSCAAPKR